MAVRIFMYEHYIGEHGMIPQLFHSMSIP
jgi:hypothetical protein